MPKGKQKEVTIEKKTDHVLSNHRKTHHINHKNFKINNVLSKPSTEHYFETLVTRSAEETISA
jgi:molybdenum cofactor biosynthesis enzyme MoaA